MTTSMAIKSNLNMNIYKWIKTKNRVRNPLKSKMINHVQVAFNSMFMSELSDNNSMCRQGIIIRKSIIPQFKVKEIAVNDCNSITYIKFMSDISTSSCQ